MNDKATSTSNALTSNMETGEKKAIIEWIVSLGGSETEVRRDVLETLRQCEQDIAAREYYLGLAAVTVNLKPKPVIDQPEHVVCYTPSENANQESFPLASNPKLITSFMVTCCACQNFKPHHQHGKGTGECLAKVEPSGICHWNSTLKECAKHQPRQAET